MRLMLCTAAAYAARLDEWVLYFTLYAYYIYDINYGG
jgi:hypothetical protein